MRQSPASLEIFFCAALRSSITISEQELFESSNSRASLRPLVVPHVVVDNDGVREVDLHVDLFRPGRVENKRPLPGHRGYVSDRLDAKSR